MVGHDLRPPDRRRRPRADADRAAHLRAGRDRPVGALLDDFARLRAANLETLAGWRLTDSRLALEGEHPELGRVTLRQLLATWVAHDLGHLTQLSRTMARQYRDAVGPWRAYLSVMGVGSRE